jgi:hypothetical protein
MNVLFPTEKKCSLSECDIKNATKIFLVEASKRCTTEKYFYLIWKEITIKIRNKLENIPKKKTQTLAIILIYRL